MKIIEPSAKLVTGYEDKPEELIELCGRICYDSQDKIAPGTAQKFCTKLRESGHTSVFEHANFIFEVNFSAMNEIEQECRDYECLTGLPSYIRVSNLYTSPYLKDEGNLRFYVSGNARAWANLIRVTGAFAGTSLPPQIFEHFDNFPALFDIREYWETNRENPHLDFEARPVQPSELPGWARERHTAATFFITCDRGISHELVRHRTASFSQQSTRYCKANKSGEIEVIAPHGHEEGWRVSLERNCFLSSCDELYNDALEHTGSPQIARSVLPTCLATKLYMTMTLERWRDFLKLRTSPAAHPDMRVIAEQIQRQLFPDEIGDSNAD